jgi:hypothetical protein
MQRRPLMARLRPRGQNETCLLIMEQPTLNLRCPFFEKIGLHAEAQPTWFFSCTWSHVDPFRTSGSFCSGLAHLSFSLKQVCGVGQGNAHGQEQVEHRLATILAVDVLGDSQLKGAN